MTVIIIDIAKDFSKYPSGRTQEDGPASGALFREKHLVPAFTNNDKVIVKLDGVKGYPSSFTEEAFGGLVREGFDKNDILAKLTIEFESNAYEGYRDDILLYIKDATMDE